MLSSDTSYFINPYFKWITLRQNSQSEELNQFSIKTNNNYWQVIWKVFQNLGKLRYFKELVSMNISEFKKCCFLPFYSHIWKGCFLPKHSNLESKHGPLRVDTTYAGFYLQFNILWQKSTNSSGGWPRSTMWGNYSSLSLKTFFYPPWGKQIKTMTSPHVVDWSHFHTVKPTWHEWMENLNDRA